MGFLTFLIFAAGYCYAGGYAIAEASFWAATREAIQDWGYTSGELVRSHHPQMNRAKNRWAPVTRWKSVRTNRLATFARGKSVDWVSCPLCSGFWAGWAVLGLVILLTPLGLSWLALFGQASAWGISVFAFKLSG